MASDIAILGIFVADLAFTAPRLPIIGETLLGQGFRMGPGGKGSNQAAAAAKAGGSVSFITRLGRDAFAEIALKTWAEAGIDTRSVVTDDARPTGAAFIFARRSRATMRSSSSRAPLARSASRTIEAARPVIQGARIFLTQLEQPIPVAVAALAMARATGVTTILNPAPAAPLEPDVFALCDVVTPNESEAALLTGLAVGSPAEAKLRRKRCWRRAPAPPSSRSARTARSSTTAGRRSMFRPSASERWWIRQVRAMLSRVPSPLPSRRGSRRRRRCASAAPRPPFP